MSSEDFEGVASVTDLRGFLAAKTDDEGRSATARLRDERDSDRDREETLWERYADASDEISDVPITRFRTDGV